MADRAVLLVHGFPLDARMWRRQVEVLSDKGLRVLAPDLPGHGADASEPVSSMDAMARRLAARLDAEGIAEVDLAGLSMGGYVCFAFWRLYRDRVRSLALIDTRAGADSEEGRKGRDAMAARIQADGARVAAEAMLPKMFTEGVAAEVRAEAEGWMLASRPAALVADLAAMRDRPDSTPDLAGISVPTLVLVGAMDAITPPAEAEAMAAAIPGARLEVIPAAAHLAPVESPDAVNRALEAHLSN